MTLDETIKEFTDWAKDNRKEQNYWAAERNESYDETNPLSYADCEGFERDAEERAEYHEQLTEWLTELKEANAIIRVCNRVLGFLLEHEIESTSTRHEVETLLKNITEYLSGGGENG